MKNIDIFGIDNEIPLNLPFADDGVRAGFPSPAQDYYEDTIDLNKDLVSHPECTFYARVRGNSMINAGVKDGDILVIDRSLEPRQGDMALCVWDGEFTVKFLEFNEDGAILRPANEEFPVMKVAKNEDFEVWGVVTYVIHRTR